MRLRAKKGQRSSKVDRLEYIREDGSTVEIDMPRQGILPHDLVHCVLESELGFTDGFMGVVARGASPEFAAAKTLVHSDALKIAESMVEAMQTQLAAGSFDYEAFQYGVRTACHARGIGDPEIPDLKQSLSVFERARALNQRWRDKQPTEIVEIAFPE